MSGQTVSEYTTQLEGAARRHPQLVRRALQTCSVVGFATLWWAVVAFEVFNFRLIVGPVETAETLLQYVLGEPMTQNGKTAYVHAGYTVFREILGVTAAVALAVPLGLAIGWSDWWDDYVFPSFEVLRPIPPVAWVPISLVVFTSELLSVVYVVFVGAFFPVLINTIQGVRSLDQEYVDAVRSLGGSRRDVFRHVVIPHALPSIFTGIVVGIGIGWIAVVAAEMISGRFGVGYIIFQAYRLMQTETVVAGIVIIGAFGLASTALVRRLGERLMPWSGGIGDA